MPQIQSASPVCPKCHKPRKLMLAEGECQRVLRCADCDPPDPMQTVETNGWLKGELGSDK
jgi:hypothetical protein